MNGNPLAGCDRYIDAEGHAVPITGRRCRICTYPLHPAITADIHPLCSSNTSYSRHHSEEVLTMTEAIRPNRHTYPVEPPQKLNAADDFTRWAGDYLLGAPAETLAEAVDTPPALGEVDATEVLEKLHPGRAARLATEEAKAANADRFGGWAAEHFDPSTDSPEARDLAAYLNRPRTN